jgi:hypothetical protein
MRIHWVSAILLSSALAVGCGNRDNQNPQNFEQNKAAPATTAPADQNQANRDALSPDENSAPAQPAGARATTAARPAPTPAPRTRRETRKRTVPGEGAAASASEGTRAAATGTPAPQAPREEFREVTIPAGTALPLELLTPLSSESAQVETPVRARVRQSVTVDGYTAIPAGSTVTGSVTDVAESGRVKGKAHLAFRFGEIELRGARERISTNTLTYQAEATKGEDATKIGAGAGIGAAIGGLLGGGSGAAKGAAIGGAAGTGVVLATKGKEVTLAEGTDIAPTLSAPLTIRVPLQ